MSHAESFSHAGTGAPTVARGAVLATVALLVAVVVVVLVLAATGPGDTQSTVSDGPQGSDAASIVHPRGGGLLRSAPSRGVGPSVSER
jgi:hypothetical protein